MPGEIELRRILNRQHMALMRRPRRMVGGGRKHDLARHRRIVQKTPEALRVGSIASKLTQTRRPLTHKSGQKIGPPFLEPFVAEPP